MAPRCLLIRSLASIFAACLLLLQAAQNQQLKSKQADGEADEEVYDMAAGITPPRIVKQVPPRYSTARGVRVDGTVTIGLVVSSGGVPKNLRVLKGLDKDVDQSAVDAVEQWRFAPAKKDDKPVAVRISLEIAFHSM
jgi:TonB family protein